MVISVKAHAKINLFLDVTAQRCDGYHDILSLMQTVSLHDTVTVEYEASADKNIEIVCNAPNVPCDNKNLAYKAADLMLESGYVKITISKNIPSEAGLAGGSADAAATFIALNKLLGDKYSIDELKALGKKLGADIPFCIEGGSCIVEGIGDIMTQCAPMPDYPIVIARMGEGMSTPYAYRKLDEAFNNFKEYSPKREKLNLLLDISNKTDIDTYCQGLFNVFEYVVESERPCVTQIKSIMHEHGAKGALMSGSGTSIFGIFDNGASAKSANDALKNIGAISHICYPEN